MYYLNKFCSAFLLTFLIFSTVEAQINPVYKIMIERGWTPLSKNDKTELTHEQMDKEFIIIMGYNDTIISNLRNIGVDLSLLRSMYGHYNEKIIAALSDCIVIGTVERKEYPLQEDDFFHTIAYIKVEEFLRNDYNLPKNEIPVMIHSGPTASEGIMIQVGEDTLKIGEKVLLFLSANELIYESKVNNQHKLYNQLINDPVIRFGVRGKYNLEDGKVIERNSVKNLADVRDDINTVLKAIPYSKSAGK